MANTSVERLIQNITSQYDNDVTAEYMMLLDAGESAITPLMIALQADDHTKHHVIASVLCDILVEVGDDEALALLNQLVYDPNNEVYTPAVRAIARLKRPQINQVLCDLLDHPAPQVRRVAAWQLGRNRSVQSAAILAQHLDEVDLETLRGILWSLGRIGDNRVVRLLEPFMRHLSDDIAFIAREAIHRIENKALN